MTSRMVACSSGSRWRVWSATIDTTETPLVYADDTAIVIEIAARSDTLVALFLPATHARHWVGELAALVDLALLEGGYPGTPLSAPAGRAPAGALVWRMLICPKDRSAVVRVAVIGGPSRAAGRATTRRSMPRRSGAGSPSPRR